MKVMVVLSMVEVPRSLSGQGHQEGETLGAPSDEHASVWLSRLRGPGGMRPRGIMRISIWFVPVAPDTELLKPL